MSDTQLILVQPAETQVVAASPGVQGPAGVSSYATIGTTTYTLSDVDRSKIRVFTSSSAITVTVPQGLSPLFDVMLVQAGAGAVTVSPAVGVTVNAAFGETKTAYQYAVATLIPIGTDTFILSGEVSA